MSSNTDPHFPTFENMDFSKGGVEKTVFCAVCESFCPCWIEDTSSRQSGHSGHWADCDTCGQVTEVLPPTEDPILQVTYDPTQHRDGGHSFDTLILEALSTQEQTDGGAEGCSTSRTIYAHYSTTDEADMAADAVEALGLSGVACEVFVEGGY